MLMHKCGVKRTGHDVRPARRCCTSSDTCSRRPSNIRTASSRVLPYMSTSFT